MNEQQRSDFFVAIIQSECVALLHVNTVLVYSIHSLPYFNRSRSRVFSAVNPRRMR